MITERQRAQRKRWIGASDVPAIMGLSPYKSAYDVWLEKTDKLENEPEETESMRLGNDLESAIAAMAERKIGKRLVRPTSTYVASNGIMAANLDRQVERAAKGVDNVEIKSTFAVQRWGPAGTDHVPDDVMVQVQAQMICSDSSLTIVSPLFLTGRPQVSLYYVRADKALANMIEEACGEFHDRCIVRDIPPEHSLPSAEHVSRVRRVQNKFVVIPDEIAERYMRARAMRKQADDEHEKASIALRAAMGDAEHAVSSIATFTYTPIVQQKISVSKLEQEYPDIAARCVMSSTYRRLVSKEKYHEGTIHDTDSAE